MHRKKSYTTRKKYTKFLGVLIDENLNWKTHISHLQNKISKFIGVLYKVRPFLNIHLLQQLYFSFVHSYLSYGNIAWCSTNKTNLSSLYRRQKHALRVITFKGREDHTKPLFQDMRVLSLFEINIHKILCLMFNSKLNDKLDIFKFFQPKSEQRYCLRSENNLSLPSAKLRCNQYSIPYRGPKLWNEIVVKSNQLSEATTYNNFKARLKKFLLNSDHDVMDYF